MMQETLAQCWEMQHMPSFWCPPHSIVDAKQITGQLGAILTVTTEPTWVCKQVIEPYHVGGCL